MSARDQSNVLPATPEEGSSLTLTHLLLRKTSHVEITREADPEEKFSGEDSHESHTLIGLQPADVVEGDVIVPFAVEPGETLFIVYGIHSAGDSFSNHDGKLFTLGAFRDRLFAENVAACAREHSAWADGSMAPCIGSHTFAYRDEAGNLISVLIPWNGYFERLSSINVEALKVMEPELEKKPDSERPWRKQKRSR